MSGAFTQVHDNSFVFPVFQVRENQFGVAPGWYFYDEELSASYERDGDYGSAMTGPYPTRDACAKAAHATNDLYLSL